MVAEFIKLVSPFASGWYMTSLSIKENNCVRTLHEHLTGEQKAYTLYKIAGTYVD